MEAASAYTRDLEQAVTEIKADEKWRREFMVMNELIREKVRLGGYVKTVASVRNNRAVFTQDVLAKILMIDPSTVNDILSTIDAHPDWDDETVAEHISFQ